MALGALRRRVHRKSLNNNRPEHRTDEQLNEVGDRQKLPQAKAHKSQLAGALLPQVVPLALLLGLFHTFTTVRALCVHRLSPSAIARYASSRVAGRVYGSVRAPMRAAASPSARMRCAAPASNVARSPCQ